MRTKALVLACIVVGTAGGAPAASSEDPPCPTGQMQTEKGCVTIPELVEKVEPIYPEQAREKQLDATVILQAKLDPTGRLTGIKVLKSTQPDYGFEDAAMKALEQWRYKPATLDGAPVSVVWTVKIDFRYEPAPTN